MKQGEAVRVPVVVQGAAPQTRSYLYGTVVLADPHQIVVRHQDDTIRAYEPHRVERR